ncbi:MAG TPA: metallophosphoesterase [Actinomycetota bacterium]|nr:metallophosphoesterase [Actinomycetota bacterium]
MKLSRVLAAGAALGTAGVVYSVGEAHRYHLRIHRLPVLPPGAGPLRVLQVSDTHLRETNLRLAAFLAALSQEPFDLVFATGDLLGEPAAVERCARLLGGLKGRLGCYYVLGSSDYYAPRPKSPTRYFTKRRKKPTKTNRTADFLRMLEEQGYQSLTNRTVYPVVDGVPWQITGMDDPFLHRDDRRLLHRNPGAAFALCVVHDPAPYLDIAAGGFDLAIAGHTHGGQVRVPFVGSLVTNSDLPNEYSMGAHWIGDTLLFVTPGLGTSKFAPVRFLSPPEASVLELVARGQG